MRKRWMGLFTAILLALTLIPGAQAESVLMEKIQKQLNAGSGFKGSLTVSGLPVLGSLAAQAQYILQKGQSQTAVDVSLNGQSLWSLKVYGQDGALAVDAGLQSGALYGFSGGLSPLLTSFATGTEGGNTTSFLPALLKILSPGDDKAALRLTEAAQPYLIKMELWMQGFADTPALEKDASGVTVMKAAYHIPAAALKAQIKQLLYDLLSDETLLPLLWEQATQAEADLYLNPALQSYYFSAVDALPLSGVIDITRRVSTMGVLMDTAVSLPLSGTAGGFKQIACTVAAGDAGDTITCDLTADAGTWTFSLNPQGSEEAEGTSKKDFSGVLRFLPAEMPNWQVDGESVTYQHKALSVAYKATLGTQTFTDVDGKNIESYTLSLSITPDWSHLGAEVTDAVKALYIAVEPMQITASALLQSGQARNSATSLALDGRLTSGVTEVTLSGQFKTTPPWTFTPVDMSAAIPWESVTTDNLNTILMELLTKPALLPLLPSLIPADQEVPGTVG